MKVLEKIKIIEKPLKVNKTFRILILNGKTNKNSFNGKILGRNLCEWVSFACVGHDIRVVDYNGKENILQFIKDKINTNHDYTIVLFFNIPLLQSTTISDIKEYCQIKNSVLCKLPIGYVINNDLFLRNKNLIIDSVYSQNIDDFYLVENKKQYSYALNVLQERINNFHIDNGVEIVDGSKVYIEPTVDISRGVIIYPNNTLKGNTIISNNVILKENNVIDNSKIDKECCISGSVINNSVIGREVFISSFCEINNSLIGAESIIGKGASINKYSIKKGSKIAPNTILGEDK